MIALVFMNPCAFSEWSVHVIALVFMNPCAFNSEWSVIALVFMNPCAFDYVHVHDLEVFM